MLTMKPIIVFIMLFVSSLCGDRKSTTIPPEPDWGTPEEFLKDLNVFRAKFAREHRIPKMFQMGWSNELEQQHNHSSDAPRVLFSYREFPISSYRNTAESINAEIAKVKNKSDFRSILMKEYSNGLGFKAPIELINPLKTFIGCAPKFYDYWYLYCYLGFNMELNLGYDDPGEAGSQCPSRFKNDDGLCVPVDPSKHTFWGTKEGLLEDVNYSRRKYAKKLGIPNMHQMTWNESLVEFLDSFDWVVYRGYKPNISNNSAWDDLETRWETAELSSFSAALTEIDEGVHRLLVNDQRERGLNLIHPLKTSIGCMKKVSNGVEEKTASVLCLLVNIGSDWDCDVNSKKVPGSECMDGYVNDDGLCSLPLPTTPSKPTPSVQNEKDTEASKSEQEGAKSSSATRLVSGFCIFELLSDEPRLNEHRTRLAEEVMENLKKPMKNPESASVDIRVIASDRGFGVLFQTVIFLLEQQQQHRKSPDFNFSVSICNVESELFPDLQRFSVFEIPVTTFGRNLELNPEEKLNSTIKKENEDYWKCLGLPTESRYILLMEDDVIVIPEFSTLLKSMIRKLDFMENVDYVKLYHPKYLRKIPFYFLVGAQGEIPREILLQIAIPAVSTSFFLCYFVKIVSGNFPIIAFLILSTVTFWDLKTFGSQVIVFKISLRTLSFCQFPSEIRYHLTGSAYFSVPESCCTQAVIFRQSSISKMLEVFDKSVAFSGYAKDHILDESSQFTGRQSDINYVAHIGSFSSVRQKAVSLSDDWREI
ncbi:unnamed protein product [Caenorhabditis brenneri]